MRKLTLSLDSLTVESFEASSAAGVHRGTVRANSGNPLCPVSVDFTCVATDCGTCVGCGSAEYTCNGCTGHHPTLGENTCGNYTCNAGETCAGDKGCVITT